MGSKYLNSDLNFRVILISAVVSSIFSFCVLVVFYSFLSETHFINSDSCVAGDHFQFCYFGKGGIWDDGDYLQTVSGFYNTVITVLLGIVAIVAALGAYSIKTSIKAQAEQELPNLVENFFNHVAGQSKVTKAVDEQMRIRLDDLPAPSRGSLFDIINTLERRLERLEEIEQDAEDGDGGAAEQ